MNFAQRTLRTTLPFHLANIARRIGAQSQRVNLENMLEDAPRAEGRGLPHVIGRIATLLKS